MKRKPKLWTVVVVIFDHGTGMYSSYEIIDEMLHRALRLSEEIVNDLRARYPEDIQIIDFGQFKV